MDAWVLISLKSNEILRGHPLGFHLISKDSITCCKGYPLAKCVYFIEIQWTPKGYPLRISSKSNGFITFCKGYHL